MLEIGKRDLPLLVSAIRDAVIYNQQLLRSETLKLPSPSAKPAK